MPQQARGGKPLRQAWDGVPEGFRELGVPEFEIPADEAEWAQRRGSVRQTVLDCLGDMPPRPSNLQVEISSRSVHPGYVMERFRFDNGVDAVVHGMAMIPAKLQQPAPAVIAVHGWGNSKEEVMMPGNGSDDEVGELLVSRGFVVVAIDSCFQGERLGSGPLGRRSRGSSEEERRKYTHAKQESSLFKLYLWQGRTLWGMMLREMQIVLDYLQTRAEVDPQRIGVVGKSMGCMMSWWLAAIDSRVKVVVGVCGVVRYTQIIAHRANHGIYAYVPGILKHFDTEAIFALSSPRPLLLLSGEEDAICPFDGIEILEGKLGSLYGRLGAAERFRSVVYSGTGHEYLPEMKEETVAWFGRHL